MNPPAFQFYTDDFLGGVADMTQSEVGAYMLLLCQQWNRGSIPVQTERQQLIAKGEVTPHVLSKFKTGQDGLLRNERLEKERQKQADYREMQRKKGVASGESRAKKKEPLLNHGSATVEPEGQPKGNSPSPSSISDKGTLSGSNYSTTLSELRVRLNRHYKRDEGSHWSHMEESTLVEVARRDNVLFELGEIMCLQDATPAEDRRYIPSLVSLLTNWTANLDRARAQNGGPVKKKRKGWQD
jgi:uncharacterized protein YdaU (DUF1376 family)